MSIQMYIEFFHLPSNHVIPFQVWQSKERQGNHYEYTSLPGHDTRVLLKQLLPCVPNLLSEKSVQALWEVNMLNTIT